MNSLNVRQSAFLMTLQTETIDENGSITKEESLKSHGFTKPKMITSEEINDLFSLIQAYINSHKPGSKEILQNKLAWCLSDEKGSTKLLEKFINEVKLSISNKELQETKEELNNLIMY